MTAFALASHLLGFVAYILGWLKGGHPERLAATALMISYAVSSVTFLWRVGDFYWASALSEFTLMLIFCWLTFRSDRWWPFVTTAALALITLTHALTLLAPDLSAYAAQSAQVGLWLVIDAALLAGVGERWLAGEAAVSRTAVWRRRRGAA